MTVLLWTACGKPDRSGWNVLLVTFDTTRADHLGCYGNEDIQTPHLDRLAAEGVLFEHAYSSVPITAPSHSTILTGLYPTGHGVRDNGMFVLGDANVTLAETLKGLGYGTAAAVGAFPLASQFGLAQGFDLYDDHFTLPYEDFRGQRVVSKSRMFFDERPAELVNEPLMAWLDEHHESPFFTWAHYFDPHLPVEPPPPYDQLYVADPYLGEIAYADEALGQLLAKLEDLGIADRTVVVMTADHGEGRGEHNELTHSTLAYNTTLHVPLIVRVPGMEGGQRVAERVGTVDIVPTVLDLLGAAVPEIVHGRSLLPAMTRDERSGDGGSGRNLEPQYAETLSPRLSHGLGELRVLFDRGYKYIFGPRPELYRLEDDPRELNDLVDEEPEIARVMRSRLERFVQDHAIEDVSDRVELDDESRRRLEALGYISSAGGETKVNERLDGSGVPPQDRVADINEVSSAKNELLHGRPLAALGLAETLLRRAPENVYYLQIQATAQQQLGRLDDAIETIESILRLDPHGLPKQDLVLQMVEALYQDGQGQRARALLAEQQGVAPTPLGQWYLASLAASAGDREARVGALREALELDESFAPARVDLAVHLAQGGDLDGAAEEIERALVDRPYYAKGHYNYGVLWLQRERPERALGPLQRATVLHPSYLQAHHAAVSAALATGDRRVAAEHVEHLRRLAPDSPLTREAQLWVDGGGANDPS
ncbi:MAG: sulfatase-like hydrolase/transferase [Acidobacteriota bacterium]